MGLPLVRHFADKSVSSHADISLAPSISQALHTGFSHRRRFPFAALFVPSCPYTFPHIAAIQNNDRAINQLSSVMDVFTPSRDGLTSLDLAVSHRRPKACAALFAILTSDRCILRIRIRPALATGACSSLKAPTASFRDVSSYLKKRLEALDVHPAAATPEQLAAVDEFVPTLTLPTPLFELFVHVGSLLSTSTVAIIRKLADVDIPAAVRELLGLHPLVDLLSTLSEDAGVVDQITDVLTELCARCLHGRDTPPDDPSLIQSVEFLSRCIPSPTGAADLIADVVVDVTLALELLKALPSTLLSSQFDKLASTFEWADSNDAIVATLGLSPDLFVPAPDEVVVAISAEALRHPNAFVTPSPSSPWRGAFAKSRLFCSADSSWRQVVARELTSAAPGVSSDSIFRIAQELLPLAWLPRRLPLANVVGVYGDLSKVSDPTRARMRGTPLFDGSALSSAVHFDPSSHWQIARDVQRRRCKVLLPRDSPSLSLAPFYFRGLHAAPLALPFAMSLSDGASLSFSVRTRSYFQIWVTENFLDGAVGSDLLKEAGDALIVTFNCGTIALRYVMDDRDVAFEVANDGSGDANVRTYVID